MRRPVFARSLTLLCAAATLAACAEDVPTGPVPAGAARAPRLATAPDFSNGRWTVATVFPWQEFTVDGASEAVAVNDAGQVVGMRGGNAFRATLGQSDAQFFERNSSAIAVNNAGDVLRTVAGGGIAVSRAAGGDVPVALTAAYDLNDRGEVAGAAGRRAAIWSPAGGVQQLDGPALAGLASGDRSRAQAISANGSIVVGFVSDSVRGSRAFYWTPAAGAQPLRMPEGGQAEAHGVNDAGLIVGWVSAPASGPQPAAWTAPDSYILLSTAGLAGPNRPTAAMDVNEGGTIVGSASIRDGVFVWPSITSTPVDVVSAACADGASPQLCRDITVAYRGRINERGQIAGRVEQARFNPDSQPRFWSATNAVVWTFGPAAPRPAAAPLASRWAQGRCLDVYGASRAPGAEAVIYGCHGGTNQAFSTPAQGTTGELRVYGDMCMAPRGDGARGEAVVLAACTGAPAQRWTHTSAGELRTASGQCADIAGWGTEDLTPVILWDCHGGDNQRWTVGAPAVAPAVALASRWAGGKCLDVYGASRQPGADIVLYGCHGAAHQQFTLPAPSATGEIRVYGGALCVESVGGQGNDGDRIATAPCTGGANQRWRRAADGTLEGMNGRCFDIAGWGRDDLTPVILWNCHRGENQQFDAVAPATVASR